MWWLMFDIPNHTERRHVERFALKSKAFMRQMGNTSNRFGFIIIPPLSAAANMMFKDVLCQWKISPAALKAQKQK